MKRYSKHQGFSLILAMGLVLIMSLTALYVVEYMIPYSRQIVGIEHASQSYYEAYKGIELGVFAIYAGEIGDTHARALTPDIPEDFSYSTIASGTMLPPAGRGNSEYNQDWNRLGEAEPIQLVVGKERLKNATEFVLSVRVPDFDTNGSPDSMYASAYGSSDGLILWQISSASGSLSTSDSALTDFTVTKINNKVTANIWSQQGEKQSGGEESFSQFYTSNCLGTQECVLKISLLYPLYASATTTYPYLEYQLATNVSLPLRFARLDAIGESYGFQKRLSTDIPQDTTNSAFDFAIFQ